MDDRTKWRETKKWRPSRGYWLFDHCCAVQNKAFWDQPPFADNNASVIEKQQGVLCSDCKIHKNKLFFSLVQSLLVWDPFLFAVVGRRALVFKDALNLKPQSVTPVWHHLLKLYYWLCVYFDSLHWRHFVSQFQRQSYTSFASLWKRNIIWTSFIHLIQSLSSLHYSTTSSLWDCVLRSAPFKRRCMFSFTQYSHTSKQEWHTVMGHFPFSRFLLKYQWLKCGIH